MEEIRQKLLARALESLEGGSWAQLSLDNLAKSAEVAPAEAKLCFERGILDIVLYHLRQGDEALKKPEGQKIREKIAELIWQRVRTSNRERTQKTAQFLSLPIHLASASKALWRTTDAIWQQAEAQGSADFSYYTKRASLAALYSQVLLFYLSPQGKEDEAVKKFIADKIDLLLKTMKALGGFVQGAEKKPNRESA